MDSTAPVSRPIRIDLPALLTPQEVAELLNASPRTVRRLAADGVLDRVRIGHRTSRYTHRSVLALVDPHDDHGLAASEPVGKASTLDALHAAG